MQSNNDDIEFQIIDWYVPEQAKKNTNKPFKYDDIEDEYYTINLFGKTSEGKNIQLEVNDYKPYFYAKPNKPISKNELQNKIITMEEELLTGSHVYKGMKWNINKKKYEQADKYGLIGTMRNHFYKMKIVSKYDYWGFNCNKRELFVKVIVKSYRLFRIMKDIFSTNFTLYETNIDPFIRFIHDRDLLPTGWISFNNDDAKEIKGEDKISVCDYQYSIPYNKISRSVKNSVAPLLICSYDIECTSSHGDFPVAIKDYKKLAQDLSKISEDLIESCNDNNCNIEPIIKSIIKKTLNKKDYVWGDHVINRVFVKDKIKIENSIAKLEEKIPMILKYMSEINKDLTNDTYEEIENKINSILTNELPELEGDPIIQIGMTFNRFGSDEIIKKIIIVLGDCEEIEGVDIIECKKEEEVIKEFKNILKKYNPDILTGYNINGFDFKYIYERTKELNIESIFLKNLGRTNCRDVPFITNMMSSSAMGEVITSYFDIEGILIIDVFTYCRRNMNLESYKLDFVAETVLKENKNDLKPSELFLRYKGNAKDRKVIAEYCIQDCALVNRLIHKLKIIENNIGMSNVCLVPLSFIFNRGQGVKIYSLVASECAKKDQVIPVLNKGIEGDDGYEGAIVLEPKTGIYIDDPIVVFDYSSLYPSSMIAENLSHDSVILKKDWNKYINFSNDKPCLKKINGIEDNMILNEIDIGNEKCYFVKYTDKRSTLPDILDKLIKERKATRNKIEHETIKTDLRNYTGIIKEKEDIYEVISDNGIIYKVNKKDVIDRVDTYNEFEKAVFDSLQLAYKITANSLYGQTGATTSPIYLKEIAASTTATGRLMILRAKEFVEKHYNADVIYGDSVMPYTPITINENNIIRVTTFEKLEGDWISYDQFKPNDDNRFNKEQFIPNHIKVWTHKGWAAIKRIIRHKTTKKIYRITTESGLVDVTEDHSLLDINENIIKPKDCIIGEELLHSIPNLANIYYDNFNSNSGIFIDQESAQKYCLTLQLRGCKNITISSSNNKYIVVHTNLIENPNKIKRIDVIYNAYNGYVYDIETEYGVFHGGIGNIILKNTDSIFCKFEHKKQDSSGCDKIIKGKEAIPLAINLGLKIEKHIKDALLYQFKPQCLNYEKVLYPFILFSKKRYVGMLYEKDPNKCHQKSMGIVLKRRDNAKIVKDIFGGVINKILLDNDLNGSFKLLEKNLNDLSNGYVDLNKLVLSKTLKSNYKDPSKIAHKVLADRITSRDPGNKPAINDRIAYVYIKTENETTLQGDKIETVDFIKDNNLVPDYLFYITNQIMNPILQLYSLCVTQIPNYALSDDYWTNLDEELKNKDIYKDDSKRAKRIQDMKECLVRELLFDKYIFQLNGHLKKNSIQKVVIKNFIEMDSINIDSKLICTIIIKESKKNNTTNISYNIKDIDKGSFTKEITGRKNMITNEIIEFICDKHKNSFIEFIIKGNADYIKKFKEMRIMLYSDDNGATFYEDKMRGGLATAQLKYISKYLNRIQIK